MLKIQGNTQSSTSTKEPLEICNNSQSSEYYKATSKKIKRYIDLSLYFIPITKTNNSMKKKTANKKFNRKSLIL